MLIPRHREVSWWRGSFEKIQRGRCERSDHSSDCSAPVKSIHGEFDPGSGRTLAACLTHASRTMNRLRPGISGERVSNTWATGRLIARRGRTHGAGAHIPVVRQFRDAAPLGGHRGPASGLHCAKPRQSAHCRTTGEAPVPSPGGPCQVLGCDLRTRQQVRRRRHRRCRPVHGAEPSPRDRRGRSDLPQPRTRGSALAAPGRRCELAHRVQPSGRGPRRHSVRRTERGHRVQAQP